MTIADLELIFTPGVGNITAHTLIERFATAERIFSLNYEQLRGCKVSESVARAIVGRGGRERAQREMTYCDKHGVDPMCVGDAHYPASLATLANHPHVLYSQGDTSLLNGRLVAFVGARRASPYGDLATHRLIEAMAAQIDGFVVVSGLATGIDGAAHRAALDVGVPTIAVLPTSLPDITPSNHLVLSRAIVERGGLLLSEQSSGVKDISKTLISRNRILVGISEGTVVVESGTTGGSMRSAEMTLEMGRSLGAVPGRITDSMSAGCNALLRREFVTPITSGADIVSMLGWESLAKVSGEGESRSSRDLGLTKDQVGLLRCFREDEPLSFVELSELTGLPSMHLQGLLMTLEVEGCVRCLSGSRYERLIPLQDLE